MKKRSKTVTSSESSSAKAPESASSPGEASSAVGETVERVAESALPPVVAAPAEGLDQPTKIAAETPERSKEAPVAKDAVSRQPEAVVSEASPQVVNGASQQAEVVAPALVETAQITVYPDASPTPGTETTTSSAEPAVQPAVPPAVQSEAEPQEEHGHANGDWRSFAALALGALGVVYGDIGTSPLYALKECFSGHVGLPLNSENVFGILSLFFWALTLIVVVKYIMTVMQADNHGEGGIMALMALIERYTPRADRGFGFVALVGLGLFGTSLLLADGMITPAISVLSAVEGLQLLSPHFAHVVVPATLVILVCLFLAQKQGTRGVANVFGPVMLFWFMTIGLIGLAWVVRMPSIFKVLNPWYVIDHFIHHGAAGVLVLGSVLLCVTGAEALYADMGHFGAGPIRLAWYLVAYPALVLNYLGQGVLLIQQPEVARENPFFAMVPHAFLLPLVLLATTATIIASQALISGAYSLAQQAMQLGYCPRLTLKHTDRETRGQIYVQEINTMLMVACCALVLHFQESSNLASAYGIAVMGTMTITTILMFSIMQDVWKWSNLRTCLVCGLFLAVDIPFLLANVGKIFHGGWVPLLIGASLYLVMTTWKRGRRALSNEMQKSLLPIGQFMKSVERDDILRVPGTAVFMTSNLDSVPPVLLHHFKHLHVLHEKVILLSIASLTIPDVPTLDRVEIKDLGLGLFQVTARYGYMQTPNVPEILDLCGGKGLHTDLNRTSFFLGRESLLTSGKSDMAPWRKHLFAYLSRNSRPVTAFFSIPTNRVLELGMQIEL